MKLINILNLEEYQEDIKKLMQENQINIYSEVNIQGYYKADKSTNASNWFANDSIGIDAKMNFAFLPEASVQKLLEAIRQFNTRNQLSNPVHAFVLNVEQSV